MNMKTMKEEKGQKSARSIQEKRNKKVSTQKSAPSTKGGKSKISKEYDRAEMEPVDSTYSSDNGGTSQSKKSGKGSKKGQIAE
jgi:hypothetical protein